MSDKVNAKLYRIEQLRVIDSKNPYKLIGQIVNDYIKKSKNFFTEIEIKESLNKENYKLRLYIYNSSTKTPSWLDFLMVIAKKDSAFKNLENKYCSFVLFIYDDNNVFAITKGYYGHHLLAEYIDHFFGLEILSRLIDKSSTEIKQIIERGIFGIEVGSQRFFRENYSLSLDDDFGKIYKGLLASIEEEDFAKLGIIKKKESTKKVSIIGSTSLEVSTNFNYKELISRVDKISGLLKLDGIEFNQFYRLSQVQLSKIKEDLNEKLLEWAYKKYKNKESIDFYHPHINNYLNSLSTQIRQEDEVKEISYSSSINFIDFINLVKDFIDISSKKKFIESIKHTYGSYKLSEDLSYVGEVTLDQWISGEIEYKEKKYFKIDNIWYLYRESFDEYLNTFIRDYKFLTPPTLVLKEWGKKFEDEGEYNQSFLTDDNFIVADRALINNIEIADLIRVDGDTMYLYHVKKGLGQDLRVLSNQLINSARLLTNIRNEGDKSTLKKYYKHISNKHYDKKKIKITNKGIAKEITENEFVDYFNNKIVLIFAYASNSSKSLTEEVVATKSRIAKLSLLYTIRDIKRTEFDFYVERIPWTLK